MQPFLSLCIILASPYLLLELVHQLWLSYSVISSKARYLSKLLSFILLFIIPRPSTTLPPYLSLPSSFVFDTSPETLSFNPPSYQPPITPQHEHSLASYYPRHDLDFALTIRFFWTTQCPGTTSSHCSSNSNLWGDSLIISVTKGTTKFLQVLEQCDQCFQNIWMQEHYYPSTILLVPTHTAMFQSSNASLWCVPPDHSFLSV